jgi:peptide/nickel transport system substrate-binding protein
MKESLMKIAKYSFYTVFGLVFVVIVGELFFPAQVSDLFEKAVGSFNAGGIGKVSEMETFRIVYPDESVSLEPTLADPSARQRLDNIYESLVKTDRDLKIRPSLAVNWGLIDDYTWEFRLRPNVKFHDGSSFDPEDVKASLDRAMTYPGSELVDVFSTIDSVDVKGDLVLRIKTKKPDPLMLQRMAMLLIIPSEYKNLKIDEPVGTGSYKFAAVNPGNEMVLERFDDYWGKKALFGKVEMYTVVDKFARVQMLVDGDADFVAFVPYDGVDFVKKNGLNIATVPSLEVQFLVFNMKSKLMNDIRNRLVVSGALNRDDLIKVVGGYAGRVNQFVSSGIFGFNPYIQDQVNDSENSEEIAEKTGISGKTVQLHLMTGLTVLGDYVKDQMAKVGVNTVVSYLDGVNLMKSMEAGKADIYFLGFKSNMGDSSGFFESMAYSTGAYNYWGYKNEYLDKLIDTELVEMDEMSRRKSLQEAMKVVVAEDVFGIPLFEYETAYAFNDKIDINPRVDGMIHFDELTVK